MPEQIGRYRILAEQGRGGVGVVYRAQDMRNERMVALKVLPGKLMQAPSYLVRFEREAKAIAALSHPAIVPVYEHGVDNMNYFFALRFLEGGSLAERIQQGPLSFREVVAIAARVGGALEHAHSHAVLHRNLRAGSVLFDEEGQAYLSDFGLITVPEVSGEVASQVVMDSLIYMSPEQIRDYSTIDHRSDVYSFGVVLFEMMAGRPPFAGADHHSLAAQHLTAPVPDMRQLRPDFPQYLGPLMAKALAKDADVRFASAGELLGAMTGSRVGVTRPRRSIGDRLVNVAIVGALLLLLVIGAVVVGRMGLLNLGGGAAAELTQTQRNDVSGYSFEFPAGWSARTIGVSELAESGSVTVAAESEAALDALVLLIDDPNSTVSGPAFVGIFVGLEDTPFEDVPGLLGSRLVLDSFIGDLPQDYSFERVRSLRVGGQAAASVEFETEQMAGRIVALLWAEQVGIIAGAAPLDEWEAYAPTFAAMLASIELYEPVPGATENILASPDFEFSVSNEYQTSKVWSININDSARGSLREGQYADNWEIQVAAGTQLTLTVRSETEGFDPLIGLFGPGGELVDADDDSGGGPNGLDARLSLFVRDGGQYTLRVISYEETAGEYIISISSP